ncbi:hypothetical protein QIS99_21130 [Streptomyces sp. B-S-A8]|uniref:Zf-HC2 domain-containing protein n=1 Tax=Streptomyces solicavernae TaxID=3043614 RepID=A0ABT6RWZ1_9ACTN|nr:hypothetical protein [Streptomyces sp. B-S-A8]MDI3388689.1 hypothetical protein [Streptomyces sp. B-S-A8]
MTRHLTDEALARLARTGTPAAPADRPPHLDSCPSCRNRLAVWQDIEAAVRADLAEHAATAPSFDVLLGPALPGATAAAAPAAAEPAGTDREARPARARVDRPWRTTWQLAVRQAALLPRTWAPLSAAGFVGAALLATAQEQNEFGVRLFGAVAVLLVMFGALMAASPRRDPRREVLFTLPVPPAAVFLARLAVVLCVDVTMALVCSALMRGVGWWPVVSAWLGEALLAAALALALSVRHSPAVGAAVGCAVWLLGVVGGPDGLIRTPVDAVLNTLLATTPWTLALAAALLAWAVTAMRSFRESPPAL